MGEENHNWLCWNPSSFRTRNYNAFFGRIAYPVMFNVAEEKTVKGIWDKLCNILKESQCQTRFIIGETCTIWECKRVSHFRIISMSSMPLSVRWLLWSQSGRKTEYMPTTHAFKEAIWLKRLFAEFGVKQDRVIVHFDVHSVLCP